MPQLSLQFCNSYLFSNKKKNSFEFTNFPSRSSLQKFSALTSMTVSIFHKGIFAQNAFSFKSSPSVFLMVYYKPDSNFHFISEMAIF